MYERRHLPAVMAAALGFLLAAAFWGASTGILVGMLLGGLAGVLGAAGEGRSP